MYILLLLVMISLHLECVKTLCVCNKTTTCSSVFECVNCDMGVDNLCISSYGSMSQSDCLSDLKSSASSKMVDWLPSTNECRYSECTEGPLSVSIYNRTLYWKTCDKGCSKAVVTKHPDSYVNFWGFIPLFIPLLLLSNMNEETCYRNCLPAITSECIATHDPINNLCGVYTPCGLMCSLGTYPGLTSFKIKCTEFECGNLTSPSNGAVDISAGTRTGNTATYSCNPGYTIWGQSQSTCGTTGLWSSSPPICKLLDCGIPANPANGKAYYTSTTYQSTLSYNCTTGYVLTGSSTNTCGTSGIWVNSMPSCHFIDCGAPTRPMNGSVLYLSTSYGSTATYSCEAGFDLNGTSGTSCNANGLWGNSSVTCIIKNCGAPSPPSDGNVSYTQTTYGSQAIFTCRTGYNISGSNIRTCQSGGSWDAQTPVCTLIDCGPPCTPANGNVSFTDTYFNSSANYSCSLGYTMSGDNITICGSDGNWNAAAPLCGSGDCGSPPQIQNGSVSYSATTYGSQAFYVCNLGFFITGPSVLTCSVGNTWGFSMPNCSQIDCGKPVDPAHGHAVYITTTYGSSAIYLCDVGYNLTGNSPKTCGSDGNWNDSTVLTCTIVDCGYPATPDFGTVTFVNTTYKSSTSYGCITGYLLSGPSILTCLSTGIWSGTTPRCNLMDCGALSPPLNGHVDYNGTTYGEQAVYSCDVGFNISGPSSRTCQPNGVWSSSAPDCLSPGSITIIRRPKAPLYIMPCICYPNKTFTNMTESQILAYLVRETSIVTKNTSAAQAKLNCRSDPRLSSTMIGTVAIIILSTLGALIICFDLMSVCKRRS